MNKTELIKNVAQSADISQKDASVAVQSVFDTITNALQNGDKVQLIGFGTFEVRERVLELDAILKQGKKSKLRLGKVPAFKAGKELKRSCKIRRNLISFYPKKKKNRIFIYIQKRKEDDHLCMK
ncbi:HU family DNA-binding protein [Bacillus cytotoxicus]